MRLASMLAFSIVALSAAPRVHASPPGDHVEPPRAPRRKSPAVATALSLAGTAIPLTLVGVGFRHRSSDATEVKAGVLSLLLTPSAGHWYAGRVLTVGLGVRWIGGAIGVLGIIESLRDSASETPVGDGDTLLALSGLMILGGALADIATASSAAHDANASRAPTTQLVPVAGPTPGGGVVGAAVVGTF